MRKRGAKTSSDRTGPHRLCVPELRLQLAEGVTVRTELKTHTKTLEGSKRCDVQQHHEPLPELLLHLEIFAEGVEGPGCRSARGLVSGDEGAIEYVN